MARVKIELPGNMPFVCRLPVRITDLNYSGHMGNDSIVSMVHEARALFFRNLGYTELQMEDAGTIMSDLAVEYKAELFFADELDIYIGAGDFTRISFDLYYQFRKVSGEKEIIAVNAKTGMICYDYEKRKPVTIPVNARIKLEGNQ